MDGLINVYKEKGYTSFDVVAVIRKMLKTKKVGHTGTLDPEAEGVLVILTGKATKLSDYLMAENKEYRAEITFGVVTDTYDNTGKVIRTGCSDFTEDDLKSAVKSFIGEQIQIPPMYSAIKTNGKKLYDLARKGIEIKRSGRNICINDIVVESFNGSDKAVMYIKCGKGTYIRSLCYDIGEALGCGAHMSSLVRTKSGVFDVDNAIKLSELDKLEDKGQFIISMEKALEGFPKVTVNRRASNILYNGGKVQGSYLLNEASGDSAFAVVYDEDGKIIGIYDIIRNGKAIQYIKPRTML